MIVVSNTSPIINLAMVGHLDLLHRLYGEVAIPQSVFDEIVLSGQGLPGSTEVQTCGWIQTRRATARTAVMSLELELDEGEAEAIALAVELKADLLLIDERKGRLVAARLGVRFVGLLGVLVEAKHRRLVTAVKPVLDDLIAKAGFWIGQELYTRILHSVGE
ncbi:MAG: DUF3368 domain-containing protein [Chloroflexi bacterium]|nr:DUF3368 domain-containing protein [Chloroflexota bacterium]